MGKNAVCVLAVGCSYFDESEKRGMISKNIRTVRVLGYTSN